MYEDFYGLNTSPFRLQPDHRFLFWSQGHQDAYKSLREGLDKGGGFVVVTGEIGAGKTTLVQLLMSEVDPRHAAVAHLSSTQLNAENFVRALEMAFGVPPRALGAPQLRSPRERLAALEAQIVKLGHQGKRVLLLIDEAQNLSPEALNELFTLTVIIRGHSRALLQCALVGQPELGVNLDQAAMHRMGLPVFATYHLGQLGSAEVRGYVLHRLTCAGWKENPKIEPLAFSALHATTGGIPRHINSMCNRLLLGAFMDQRNTITLGDVEGTAAELRDELGVDSLPSIGPQAAPRPLADGARPATPAFMVSSIAARMDSIEGKVTTMIERVQQLSWETLGRVPAPSLGPTTPGRTPGRSRSNGSA